MVVHQPLLYERVGAHPISVPCGFGSKQPLPIDVGVRLHIPMTHRNAAGTIWRAKPTTGTTHRLDQ